MRELGCGRLVVAAATLEHKDAATFATLLGLPIDLLPEYPKINERGEQRYGHHEPDGRDGNDMDWEDVSAYWAPIVPTVREDNGDDRDDLDDHLEFANVRGLNGEAF